MTCSNRTRHRYTAAAGAGAGAVTVTAAGAVNAADTVALAAKGWRQALRDDRCLAKGLNTHDGHLTNGPVGAATGIDSVALEQVLS